jgi:hypothetical protein
MDNPNARTRSSFWADGRPLACGLAVIGGVLRFVPYLNLLPTFNFSPVGGLGVFGGARLKWWPAFSIPILVMAVTDVILWLWKGSDFLWIGLFPCDPFVYVSLLINVILSRYLLSRTESPLRIGAVSLFASIQFFVITNLGVWLVDPYMPTRMYSRDWSGLLHCYQKGLEFYQRQAPLGYFVNTMLSDLVFIGALFGAHALLTRVLFPSERVQRPANMAVLPG